MDKHSNSTKSRTRQVLATALIALLCVHLYGLLYTVSVHNAFAATETYTVENVIYMNITVMGKSPANWEIIKLTVGETPDAMLSTKATNAPTFNANITGDYMGIQDFNGRQEIAGSQMEFAGHKFNVTGTQYGVMTTYHNGTSIVVNTSDYYENFQRIKQAYPVKEKLILFDSPLNYAEHFCECEGYTLNNIVNATYVEYMDTDSLNAFSSHLVKTDYLVTEPINNSELGIETAEQLKQFGGDLNSDLQAKCPWCVVIGFVAFVVAILVVPQICSAVTEMKRMEIQGDIAKHQQELDAEVTVHAINAERDVQIALVGAKAANEQKILDMIENGTLTYDEGVALLSQMGSDYDDSLGNRSVHVQEILDDYYNHTSGMWDKYTTGLGVATSWTDYLFWIIVFIIVGFAIYIIYVAFLKKGPKTSSGNVFVVS